MRPTMTRKRERFVAEYLVDRNGAQAAIRAGFSTKAAAAAAYRMLKDPAIKSAVDAAQAAAVKKINIDAQWVLTRLARIADSDIRKIFDGRNLKLPGDLDDDTASAIAAIEVETEQLGNGEVRHVAGLKLWDKGKTLVDIGRHLGMFKDKLDVEHSGAATVVLNGDEALY